MSAKRRSPKQRCIDLAKEHGWTEPCDEGDCISCDCPPGTISEDVHGIVEGYDRWAPGCTKAKAYAYISGRILDGVEKCETPGCCTKLADGKWLVSGA
ncbi:MAG TPA: hypothetical protein VMX94_02645 [Armatimonadota bacterium]|nr:hypothetical protein [Armatimonadota bacterium]